MHSAASGGALKAQVSSRRRRRRRRQQERLLIYLWPSPAARTRAIQLSLLVLFVGLQLAQCKPQTRQQLQRTAEFDKQLVRKALDESQKSESSHQASASISHSHEPQQPQASTTATTSSTSSNQLTTAASSLSSTATSATTAASVSPSLFNSNNNGPINFQCPEQFGYYTDTRDCTKYYVCVFGEVLHENCTGGLRFSRELQTCDWPRNVDCPSNATSASGGSSTTPFGPAATTLAPSGGGGSSQAAGSRQQQQVNGDSPSSSMVFADEGSDPQQPSFDEAVSPVITPDGAIHLHDGSGGTFGLQPNHQRPAAALQAPGLLQDGTGSDADGSNESSSDDSASGSGQSSSSSEPGVDVFVKPLQQLATTNPRLRPQANGRSPQQAAAASSGGSSKLQPATLPSSNRNQQARANQFDSADTSANNQPSFSPPDTSPESDGGDSSAGGPESPEETSAGDSELGQPPTSGLQAAGEPSISSLADRESEPQPPAGESSNSQELDNNNSNEDNNRGSGYVPPVMTQSGAVAAAAGQRQQQNSRQQPKSSQLLSVVSSHRAHPLPVLSSSFKPSQPFNPISGAGSATSGASQQLFAAPVDSSNNNQRSNNQFVNNEDTNQQEEESRSHTRQNFITRTMSQQQQNSSSSQLLNINTNNNNNNNINSNQRQFRLLNNQQQFFPTPMSAALRNSNSNNGPMAGERQQQSANSRFSSPLALDNNQQQTIANNVNFNDSSKLIRLPSSQFEPISAPMGHSNGNSFSRNQQPAGSEHNQQFSGNQKSTNFPVSGSRSQNVLFSQQPFGFAAADTAESINNNNSNGDDSQLDQSAPRDIMNQPISGGGQQAAHSSQQQQQRRSRPPKRQQIPHGAGSRAGSRSGGHQSARLGGPSEQQSAAAGETATTATTTTTTASSATSQPFVPASSRGEDSGSSLTSIGAGQSLGMTGSGESDPQDETGSAGNDDELNDDSGNLRQANGGPKRVSFSQNMRPIVAPTTVNFHQGGSQQQQASSFSTSPPAVTTSSAAAGGRRFLEPAAANLLRNNLSQGQRSNLINSISGQQLQSASTEPPATDNQQQQSGSSSTPAAATSQPQEAAGGGQDQAQLVANRYLNSAIDALEAGQPFGAVDYEFDILNDNSTERRPPATTASSSGPQLATTTLTTGSMGGDSAPSGRRQQPTPTRATNQQQHQRNGQLNSRHNNNSSQSLASVTQQQANKQRQQFNLLQPANNNEMSDTIGLTNGQPRAASGSTPAARVRGQQAAAGGGSRGAQQPQTTQSASVTAAANQQAQREQLPVAQQPSKRPRPTNKKISVNHEQALANNRASLEPARRPEPVFGTPNNALQAATKCDSRVCRLPDCKCGDTQTPGQMDPKLIPQVVLLTFDDAVNDLNWEIYEELFTGRTNPNGCPILATFYVSHEWTDYGQVQTLYSRGHEMASHSITHSFGEKFSKSQWFKEVNGQREILNMYGGVKMNDVRGMRAPFLQIGGNKMFEMLYDANFTYDSSMPIFENSPPLWPYTLDYQMAHECMITPCPTKSFPGVWEVGMTMWVDLRGGRCSMGDACSNPPDEDGVYEMLMKNFNRHYKSNRAPFGLFYHSAWFNTVHHRRGFLRFIGQVNSLSDVFFTTNWQMLQWMRKPTPMSEINSFEPWQCPAKSDRPPPCFHPSVCNVKSEHGTRFMKTCQPCPVNQQYPWVGSTGFKGKQAAASGSG